MIRSSFNPVPGVEVSLPEFMNTTEDSTFQVCASVSPMRERDVILMFTLMPDREFSSFASKYNISTFHITVSIRWSPNITRSLELSKLSQVLLFQSRKFL